MKCPRCGSEMTLDSHRKYSAYMCYECGYIEGRYNELTAFISTGLGVDQKKVREWLDKTT